ncbi:hypothetical protein TYRP_009920 [Tyrophagus putrescentiae]|nr:hypothetical protein TYRP_009920 [Tyrophagus putrescentiae]
MMMMTTMTTTTTTTTTTIESFVGAIKKLEHYLEQQTNWHGDWQLKQQQLSCGFSSGSQTC